MKLKTGIKAGKGLGDIVDDFTRVTGLKAATESISRLTGQDCGCEARRERLNQIWSG